MTRHVATVLAVAAFGGWVWWRVRGPIAEMLAALNDEDGQ